MVMIMVMDDHHVRLCHHVRLRHRLCHFLGKGWDRQAEETTVASATMDLSMGFSRN
jgi:hypothetical protein